MIVERNCTKVHKVDKRDNKYDRVIKKKKNLGMGDWGSIRLLREENKNSFKMSFKGSK